MILHIHSDSSYLPENEVKIRAGGFSYMGTDTKTDKKLTKGAILIISKVLKNVMSLAAICRHIIKECARFTSTPTNKG
jgi:hypothetical protein